MPSWHLKQMLDTMLVVAVIRSFVAHVRDFAKEYRWVLIT